jgi:hypothetical protein
MLNDQIIQEFEIITFTVFDFGKEAQANNNHIACVKATLEEGFMIQSKDTLNLIPLAHVLHQN